MTPITDDFFRSRLDQMIDLRRPLPVLASRLPWQEIEASIAPVFDSCRLATPHNFQRNQ